MNKDKYVFAQLVEFLNRNDFNYLVRKYQTDRYVKSFFCWNQLLVMMFGQLAKSESLRDLIVAIEAHWKKSYHLGFGKSVPEVIWLRQTSKETTEFSRSMPIIWWLKHARKAPKKSLDLMVTYMLLTQQR